MGRQKSREGMQRKGDRWEGWLAGTAPVQGHGFVDGRPWHFRARGHSWGLTIAESPNHEPDDVGVFVAGWVAEGEFGIGVDASGMPLDTAWALVTDAIEKFQRGILPYVTPTQTKRTP